MTETGPRREIRAFGEAAVLVELASADDAQALFQSLAAAPVRGVTAAVPGRRSLLVEFDPLSVEAAGVQTAIAERLQTARGVGAPVGRLRTIPVVYGGEFGPDLDEIADLTGLHASRVVELHSATDLRALFLGFAPGFAYLGALPNELQVARLATPRTRTPAGSVAIAGDMTGIYPAELPGGWRVIGRTPIDLFDPRRDPPSYLLPGDRIRFEPIGADEWSARAGVPDDW